MDMPDTVSSSRQPLNNHPSIEVIDPSIRNRCHGYTDLNAVDAVGLLNSKIDIAMERQRVSIDFELQNKLKVNTYFKGKGNKIHYLFNEEGLQNLDTLANNSNCCDLKVVLSFIDTAMRALTYRYKLLKITDKHGSDTAKEYTDSDIADNGEDATKLRSVVARAATEKRQNQTPYSRNQPSFT
jgi:hypothetical protein